MDVEVEKLKNTIANKIEAFNEYQEKMNSLDGYMSDRVHWTNQMSDLSDSILYYEGLLTLALKRSKS